LTVHLSPGGYGRNRGPDRCRRKIKTDTLLRHASTSARQAARAYRVIRHGNGRPSVSEVVACGTCTSSSGRSRRADRSGDHRPNEHIRSPEDQKNRATRHRRATYGVSFSTRTNAGDRARGAYFFLGSTPGFGVGGGGVGGFGDGGGFGIGMQHLS
jgi:hypothetical protein